MNLQSHTKYGEQNVKRMGFGIPLLSPPVRSHPPTNRGDPFPLSMWIFFVSGYIPNVTFCRPVPCGPVDMASVLATLYNRGGGGIGILDEEYIYLFIL